MKSVYKNKVLNFVATMAQSIGFNNAKKGKLTSTNVQDAIDEVQANAEAAKSSATAVGTSAQTQIDSLVSENQSLKSQISELNSNLIHYFFAKFSIFCYNYNINKK